MRSVSHSKLKEIIKICYDRRVPLYIWGPPGIGKSCVVREVTEELDIKLIDTRISQFEPSDLRGLPSFNKVDKTTEWFPPNFLPKEGKGIWFADEINLAPPSIQAATYQLVLDRRLGDYVLPDGWVVMAAGNRIEDKASVFDLPAPLANRFAHIELCVPTAEQWTNWAIENGIDYRLISFINWKPSLLYKFSPDSNERAFPTPRTNELCSKMIKGITDLKIIEELVSCAIGEGAAIEFTAFLKLSKKINADDILNNPKKVTEINEISMKYTIISGISEKYKLSYKEDKSLLNKTLEVVNNLEPEFAALLLRMINSVDRNYFKSNSIKLKVFDSISSKFGKFLI
jgi:hypothetical protein